MSTMSTDLHEEILLDKIFWPDSTDITQEQIHNMAASIRVHGQVEPIVVCPPDGKGMYRGVCGRLRYEGMKFGWQGSPQDKTILARVYAFKGDVEMRMWQLVENLHRRDITAMQRALQYRSLYTLLKKEHGEEATVQTLVMAIEDCTGNKQSKETVKHYLSLTTLQPETQEALTGERMPLRYGLELLRIEDPKRQVKAAKEIQQHPGHYDTVQSVKYHVDGFITDQQMDKQRKRLHKKAEELRKQGKTVIIEAPYGDGKDRMNYSGIYGETPAECKECAKLGVILSGNFQQKPMCADPKCRREREAKEQKERSKEQKESTQALGAEQAKVYDMAFDVRHWRIAVIGLIDEYELRNVFPKLEDGKYANRDERIWIAINELSLEECQMILIRKAVEQVLTGSHQWGDDEPAKKYLVQEFNLTPGLFLKKEKEE